MLPRSRNKTIVMAPAKCLESYIVISICLLKERNIEIYEFDEGSIPEKLQDYHKIAGRPSVCDYETIVNGGVPTVGLYIDARYPHPPLYPGNPQEVGHRSAFIAILDDRTKSMIEAYQQDGDVAVLHDGLKDVLSKLEQYFTLPSLRQVEYTMTEVYFCGLLMFMEELGFDFNVFTDTPAAFNYINRITSSTLYDKMKKALVKSRESTPFWEDDSFDEKLYSIPA